MKTLQIGSTGNEVKVLQKKIGATVDGSFGPLTAASLKTLQSAYGLKPDGICGPLTWARVLTTKVLDYTLSNATFNILKVNKNEVDFGLTYDIKPLGIKAIVANNKADFTMNAGMYNNAPSKPGYGLSIVDTIINGKVVGGGNYVARGFGFSEFDAGITTTSIAKVNYPNYIGFSPDLFPNMDLKGLSLAFTKAKAYRTGIGTKGDFVFFVTTNVTMDLATFKKKFVELGCTDAGNFDGGGSTQSALFLYDTYIKQTDSTDSRKNATYLTVKLKKKHKISIDDGHGGTDPGTHSDLPALLEKDLNLNIAKEYERLLLSNGRFETFMTRPNNETLDITARAKAINTYAPDLIVSVHNNAGGGHGFEIIHNDKKVESKTFAELLAVEYLAIGQTKHNVNSKVNSFGTDWYGIQRLTKAPCVIAEYAYMDTDDVLDIDTLAEQKQVANALYLATIKYFKED